MDILKKSVIQKLFLGSVVISPILLQAEEKPNIVFIIADDVSHDDIGCYGNKVVKTPLIVFWPNGIIQKGVNSSGLISSIDVAPTILELAGVDIPEQFQGTSFAEVLKNPSTEIRTVVFSEHNWHDFEAHERMIRNKKFLYILNSRPWLSNCGPADSKGSPSQHSLNRLRDEGKLTPAQTDVFSIPRPAEELYDMENDPHQLINVASLPKYRKELQELRRLLNNWRTNTGDTTPDDLTPDWYDRETGKDLKNEKRRGTMSGIIILN